MDKTDSKCITCNITKKQYNVVRRNLPYILLFVALWFFVSGIYPFPFFFAIGAPVDPLVMQPILIATAIMFIPFVLMMFAWKKRPPKS